MVPTSRVNERPPAIGRQVEDFVGSAAVEIKRVDAGLTLDLVAAVARIPDEAIVARAQNGSVVALVAVDDVVAVAAHQQVDAIAAEDGVVADAAVDGELGQDGKVAGRAEKVVAAVHVENDLLGRAEVDRERRRIEPVKPHARAVGGDGELLGAIAAIDLGGVDAGAALEQVGVVARVPDEAVVAALAEDLVVGVAAGQRIIAVAAEQQVEAALAEQGVIARLAEQRVRCPNRRS